MSCRDTDRKGGVLAGVYVWEERGQPAMQDCSAQVQVVGFLTVGKTLSVLFVK